MVRHHCVYGTPPQCWSCKWLQKCKLLHFYSGVVSNLVFWTLIFEFSKTHHTNCPNANMTALSWRCFPSFFKTPTNQNMTFCLTFGSNNDNLVCIFISTASVWNPGRCRCTKSWYPCSGMLWVRVRSPFFLKWNCITSQSTPDIIPPWLRRTDLFEASPEFIEKIRFLVDLLI